jgi:hypothetical protein
MFIRGQKPRVPLGPGGRMLLIGLIAAAVGLVILAMV